MDVSESWQDKYANPLFFLAALVRWAHLACWVLQENIYFWSYNSWIRYWPSLFSQDGRILSSMVFIFVHGLVKLCYVFPYYCYCHIIIDGRILSSMVFICVHGLVKLCYVFPYYCNFCQNFATYFDFCKFHICNLSWTYLSLWHWKGQDPFPQD